MTALLAGARSVLHEVGAAKTGYENATNLREEAYTDLDKLGMRVLSELKASGALTQTVNDAKGMVRKLTAIEPSIVLLYHKLQQRQKK